MTGVDFQTAFHALLGLAAAFHAAEHQAHLRDRKRQLPGSRQLFGTAADIEDDAAKVRHGKDSVHRQQEEEEKEYPRSQPNVRSERMVNNGQRGQ